MSNKIKIEKLNVWFGNKHVLHDINLNIVKNQVTAIIGPSGCGKTTLIRSINKMHEIIPNAKVTGKISMDNLNIYGNSNNYKTVDSVLIRRKIGMVFQKPNPFPTMSVFDNVIAGLKLRGVKDRKELKESVEKYLKMAHLWDEVMDDLDKSGASLSGGQQQRLCIARAIAVEPEVILMDEPCSALDPIATDKIESLIYELKKEYTVVIVTHNMQQAARISDYACFMYLGKLIEYGETTQIFENPHEKLTENYITGRFG
ncbi:MAG: phosphate ABC transporter ATP-binding protein PstB [Candidatus Lokiarchaeota archaeon]|jgi:phosphate transport system ATP-binding protein